MAIRTITGFNKIYRFPENLVDAATDEAGKPVLFMLFEISSPSKGAMMSGDAAISDNSTDITDGRPSFNTDLSKIRRMEMTNQLTTIDTAIALPMPNDHVVTTAVDYDTKFKPNEAYNLGNIAMSNSGFGSKLLDGILSYGASKVGGSQSNLGQLAASQGIAINPRHEVMFTGIDFRSFSFNYTFAPKSAAETAQLRSLINTFRFYALPEMSDNKVNFTFPGVFRISFFVGENPNIWVPKIATSVLRRVNVNYSPGSIWSTLPLGEPTQLNLTLEFTEIELVDRLKIDDAGERGAQGGY